MAPTSCFRAAATVLAIALPIATAESCGPSHVSPQAPPVVQTHAALNRNFEVHAGERVAIDGEPLVITFDKVTDDSRCPTGTTCVWEGDAVVQLAVSGAHAERGSLALHAVAEKGREGAFQTYRIRIVQLVPMPTAAGPVAPAAYVATLIVSPQR